MLLKPNFLLQSTLYILLFLAIAGCKQENAETEKPENDSLKVQSVVRAQDWTDLFVRKEGWFGGDGIFAIPLDGREFAPAGEDSENLILFSDTMIGEEFGDSLTRGEFHMINNSVAILKGSEPDPDNIEFYYNEQTEEKSGAIFVPQYPGVTPGEYFWLGDGFVNIDHDSTMYIFAYSIINVEKKPDVIFTFKQIGISILSIPYGSKPPFTDHRQISFPFYNLSDTSMVPISFGSGIFVNTKSAGAPDPDGYIYIYGTRGFDKELMVARVEPKNFIIFNQWQFWDGKGWSADVDDSAPVSRYISNEMSVSPLNNGKYLLAYQYKSILPDVAIQIGESPVGPFGPVQNIWSAEEINEDDDFFVYNAKAHPSLSTQDSILITYNVNSFDFHEDIITKPHLYRPRFIWLTFEK